MFDEKKMKLKSVFFVWLWILFTLPAVAVAEEMYADVTIPNLPHWNLTLMQTFNGSVPSRAWIYEKNDAEVFISVMVTEGIRGGLEGQDMKKLAKLYMDSFVGGWGGRLTGPESGTLATFCGGENGYKGQAQFGEKQYDYYGCLRTAPDLSRTVAFVTWVAPGIPESVVASRLLTFIEGVQIDRP